MKHITEQQRYTISVMIQKGHSQKEIADIIGKDKSTISRKINRNRDKRNKVYKHELAHKKYVQSQKNFILQTILRFMSIANYQKITVQSK